MRAIQATSAKPLPTGEPAWMAPFLDSLAREDLASATLRGYRYDLPSRSPAISPGPETLTVRCWPP